MVRENSCSPPDESVKWRRADYAGLERRFPFCAISSGSATRPTCLSDSSAARCSRFRHIQRRRRRLIAPQFPPPAVEATPQQVPPTETVAPDKRQLDYANALFATEASRSGYSRIRKYFWRIIPARPAGRVLIFSSANRIVRSVAPARRGKAFRRILDDYGDSEFAGPAAYVLAETAFTEKDYAEALPLFHRAAAKSKEPAVALSARYFEARCLEMLDRKDEAADIYQQVIDAKNPNPYREDSRLAAAAIFVSAGKESRSVETI